MAQASEIVSRNSDHEEDDSWPIKFVIKQIENVFAGLVIGEPACSAIEYSKLPINASMNASEVCALFTDYVRGPEPHTCRPARASLPWSPMH